MLTEMLCRTVGIKILGSFIFRFFLAAQTMFTESLTRRGGVRRDTCCYRDFSLLDDVRVSFEG